MRQLADGVHQLALAPRDALNTYLVGDVLVDAGTSQTAKRLLRNLAGRVVNAHALTHAHSDHAGGSRAVADALGVPGWVGARGGAEGGAPLSRRRRSSTRCCAAWPPTRGRPSPASCARATRSATGSRSWRRR